MAKYKLQLFIMDYTPLAVKAIENMEKLCQLPMLADMCECEVINLRENPHLLHQEKIIATPVLIKKHPEPVRRFIGDLSNHEQILMELRAHDEKE